MFYSFQMKSPIIPSSSFYEMVSWIKNHYDIVCNPFFLAFLFCSDIIFFLWMIMCTCRSNGVGWSLVILTSNKEDEWFGENFADDFSKSITWIKDDKVSCRMASLCHNGVNIQLLYHLGLDFNDEQTDLSRAVDSLWWSTLIFATQEPMSFTSMKCISMISILGCLGRLVNQQWKDKKWIKQPVA